MSADLSTSQTCYILQESGTAGSYILHHISQILHPTGQVLNSSGPRTIDVLLESNMGRFEPGDIVLDILKMEPTSVGGSIYEFTDKQFPIFVEDIRKRNMQDHLEELDTSRCSARVATGCVRKWQLSADGNSDILRLLSETLEDQVAAAVENVSGRS